jgi:hypothetical protein
LANNKVFSIIEDSPHKKYSEFLAYESYDRLVKQCEFYLGEHRLRQQVAERAFLGFSEYPESEFLKSALASSL